MKYQRFEELPVWQAAIDLAVRTYEMTEAPEFKGRYSLRDQIERAAVSVSNNIAEGFERGTNPELLTFLYIARGSTGEVRSMLCMLEKMAAFRNLESGIRNLKQQTESISKQLGGWIQALLNSGMKGQRYVTEKVRAGEQAKRRARGVPEKARADSAGGQNRQSTRHDPLLPIYLNLLERRNQHRPEQSGTAAAGRIRTAGGPGVYRRLLLGRKGPGGWRVREARWSSPRRG